MTELELLREVADAAAALDKINTAPHILLTLIADAPTQVTALALLERQSRLHEALHALDSFKSGKQ